MRLRLLPLAIAVVAAPAVARAQSAQFSDPYDVPDAPRPPTLPELTHSGIEGTLETTEGALIPNAGGVFTHAYVQRLAVEAPLALRRWYLGASYELAAGGSARSFEAVGGNLQVEGRTLWATRTGLGFGGGLALGLPTASFDPNSGGGLVATNSATLRPWDVTYFIPGVFAVRPFLDLRVLYGRLIVQGRQGLDLTVDPQRIGDRRLYALLALYVGWRATPELAAGVEAFEEYSIVVPGVSDGARTAFVLSPNLRVSLPWVQPAISLFTNLGTPLYGANESFWGFRLAVTVVYDPGAVLKVRAQ